MSKEDKRKILLRARIEQAQAESRAYIEDKAAQIKKECENIPFDSIVLQLRRGLCDCVAARTLIDGE
jgi:hypothetical protein